jgi:hypothetical protein
MATQTKHTTIEIDGETFEVESTEMLMREILPLVGLNADESYLIELKGEGKQVNHLEPDEQIKIHNKIRFITGDRSPAPVA